MNSAAVACGSSSPPQLPSHHTAGCQSHSRILRALLNLVLVLDLPLIHVRESEENLRNLRSPSKSSVGTVSQDLDILHQLAFLVVAQDLSNRWLYGKVEFVPEGHEFCRLREPEVTSCE